MGTAKLVQFLVLITATIPDLSALQDTPKSSLHHQTRTHLFPCQPNIDFRILLLGQSYIKYPSSNFSIPSVSQLIQLLNEVNASIIFTNLETAINGSLAQEFNVTIVNPAHPHVSPPEVIDTLISKYNVNFLSTANNHFSDLGVMGTLSGLKELNKRGITHSGAGIDEEEAIKPGFLFIQKHKHENVKKIAVHSIASSPLLSVFGGLATSNLPGVNAMQSSNITSQNGRFDYQSRIKQLEMISSTSQKTNLLITYHHNHFVDPINYYDLNPDWMDFAHRTIDMGSDIYLSQGTPNIRGIELYHGKPIFYSNGNFIFQSEKNRIFEERGHYVIDLCYDSQTLQKLKGIRLIPIITTDIKGKNKKSNEFQENHGLPSVPTLEQSITILRTLQSLSSAGIWIDEEQGMGYVHLT